MPHRARAGMADIELARVLAAELDEVRERLEAKLRARNDQLRELADQNDRGEILVGIVRHRLEQQFVEHRRPGCGHDQRVAVRRGSGDVSRAVSAAGAGPVFDQEGLAKFFRQRPGDGAQGDIGAAAGGKRMDDDDRPRRPLLRSRRLRHDQSEEHETENEPSPIHFSFLSRSARPIRALIPPPPGGFS